MADRPGAHRRPVVSCPLCLATPAPLLAELHSRRYHGCERCGLVAMDPRDRLGREEELAHYGTHENDPTDTRYRSFLDRLAEPLVERLPPGARGLDYGSGPGPTLSLMLEERGFPTADYDPFFAPDRGVVERSYDFIACTETLEHFFDPRGELERLDALLRPGGWLGVMTQLLEDGVSFDDWHYVRDPTHVSFYRPRTMSWIAAWRGWSVELAGRGAVLFHKPTAPRAAS